MGYDAALASTASLSVLYRQAYRENRIVVTRNRRVRAGCLLRVVHLESVALGEQLTQLLRELSLTIEEDRWFRRCDVCNTVLEPIEKANVKPHVPPYVFKTQSQFHRCPACARIYWTATHWRRACRFLEHIRTEARHA